MTIVAMLSWLPSAVGAVAWLVIILREQARLGVQLRELELQLQALELEAARLTEEVSALRRSALRAPIMAWLS